MKLIVGLGNPGLVYAGSRHNIGFAIVKSLAKSLRIVLKNDNFIFSAVGEGKICEGKIVLAIPRTYMNLSGKALKALVKKFGVKTEDLLIICDDMDLEPGRIKVRPGGSSAGHRGIESVIGSLGTRDFARLRIGIGRPKGKTDPADYVLKDFLRNEKMIIREAKETAVNCCLSWLEKGINETMNTFNISLPVGRQGGK